MKPGNDWNCEWRSVCVTDMDGLCLSVSLSVMFLWMCKTATRFDLPGEGWGGLGDWSFYCGGRLLSSPTPPPQVPVQQHQHNVQMTTRYFLFSFWVLYTIGTPIRFWNKYSIMLSYSTEINNSESAIVQLQPTCVVNCVGVCVYLCLCMCACVCVFQLVSRRRHQCLVTTLHQSMLRQLLASLKTARTAG